MEPNQTQYDPTAPVAISAAVDYPVKLSVIYPEQSSRLLALLSLLFFIPKIIILIPHLFVVGFLGFIASFAWIFGQFAVLFTGKYPKGFFDFIVGVMRWQLRVNGYLMGLTDQYPPFSME